MKIATRWSTARREYRCDEVNSWAHAGRIKPDPKTGVSGA